MKVTLKDFKELPELVLHFLLPLNRQACWTNDERPFRLASLSERLPNHPSLDGFTETYFVSQQKPPLWATDNFVRSENLMRQYFRASVA